MARGEHSGGTIRRPGRDPWSGFTAGYRFFIAEHARTSREALQVRSSVYAKKVGHAIEVPDTIDERAWLLVAEHVDSDRVVGTMRITPRDLGPFECEQFFDIPLRLRRGVSVEITRFAILPTHRRKPDALPAVSIGLFRLAIDLCRRIEADWVVIASRAEQIETYRWLGFEQTGIISDYGTLAGAPHELLWFDFGRRGQYEWHGMAEFFGGHAQPEVALPEVLPVPGVWLERLRRGRAATAGSTS